MLRVGVFGAGGRMGKAVCAAVNADPDLQLVAAVDPAYAGQLVEPVGIPVVSGPEVLAQAGAEVAVDFTVAASAAVNAAWCAANNVHAVIGTTGFSAEVLCQLGDLFQPGPANCIFAPNFAIGAVLMMRFAELAAPWFDSVEIVELHHDAKLDAPSGTALSTAQRMAAARGTVSAVPGSPVLPPARGVEGAPGVRVHSVRLRGLVAHQEVLLGTTGQLLTLRHDSLDRSSFMPGVLLAVKAVTSRRGFTQGLDAVLGV
jgi:4-hydroxy-tetrahydrodipicolinate reductase